MFLPFTNTIEQLLKNRKWLWISPVVFLLIITASRATNVFFKASTISFFAEIVCLVIASVFMFVNVIVIINFVFDSKSGWCNDVSAFHSIGYSFYLQIFLRIFIIVFMLELFAGLFIPVSSMIPQKFILLVPPVVLSFVFFRLLAVWMGFGIITYIPFVLFAVSFFYPVYLLPNPVFIMRGQLMPVTGYVFIYSVLYLLVDMRFAYYTWREICIGWIF